MERNYKVEEYTNIVHHDATTGEHPWECEPAYDEKKKRFRVVSTDTGEILDDAQGYGYTTMKKAYAAYAYKTRDKSKDKERKEKEDRIRKWLKDNPDFRGLMEMTAFDIVKGDYGPDGKMDTKLVKELLKKSDLTIDFSAYDLLKVWRKT